MQRLLILGLVLCLIVAVVPLGAQTTAGSIVGTVTDPSGAIIAGAAITITNMGTNIAVKTTTDSSGEYVRDAARSRQVFGSCGGYGI